MIFPSIHTSRAHLRNVYSFEDIIRAYLKCKKHKGNRASVRQFDAQYLFYLQKLWYDINHEIYQISPSTTFIVTYPKPREVWAAAFVDRIVHHLIYDSVVDFYHPRFIHTNCACIPGKGTDFAVNYALKFARSVTQDWTKTAYILKFDIHNFFVSINKEILWNILVHDLSDDTLTMRLFKQIIFNDPTQNAIIIHPEDINKVPYHKSLWHTDKLHGLAIGDLPNQLCAAGIFLDGLDKRIVHKLKCSEYVRYVDDGILFSTDYYRLVDIRDDIDEWLLKNRELHLSKDKTYIAKIENGFDFVGKHIHPYRKYIRNMTKNKAYTTVDQLIRHPYNKHFQDAVNSYFGMMRHTDSFNIRRNIATAIDIYCPNLYTDTECTKIMTYPK